MCVFVYTLPRLCGHKHFQNVAECAVARGLSPFSSFASIAAAAEGEQRPRPHPTLASPVFLFDTARDARRTPETYAQRFACPKRQAIRPVLALCEGCARKRRQEREEEKKGFLAVPAVASSGSLGSSVGLVAASGSAGEVCTSGMFCSWLFVEKGGGHEGCEDLDW